MNNKQELINWMKEQRVNLPFESKVHLIWDYWKNKDTIPNLKKDVASWKDAYQLERTQNQALDKKVTEKNDRIAQLDQILKNSAIIFQNQINIIDNLTQQLQKEVDKGTTNTDLQKHLQADIKRLAQERKDLANQKKDLEDEEVKNQALRDKEIADLKAENKKVKDNLTKLQKELDLEKGWWDKWFKDETIPKSDPHPLFHYIAKKFFIDKYTISNPLNASLNIKLNYNGRWEQGSFIYNLSDSTSSENVNPEYKKEKYGKEIIKFIYEYYRWLDSE